MKPNKYMLVRKMEKEKEKFVHQMGLLLDEMVNYGTHVLDICEKEKPFTELDTPIGTTYTQFLSMLDGISILIRKGNGDAIKPVLRSLLETKFNLEYLIKVEPEKGVLAYKLAHIHNQIKQLKRLDQKSDQGREFSKTIGDVELPTNNSNKRLQLLEDKLKSPKYKKVQEEWDRLKKQYKKEPLWHALFQGQRTVKDIADFLEQSVYYSIVYKELSEDVHGGSTIKRLKKSAEDNIGISPGIRRIEEIPAMAYLSIKFAEEVFSVMIKEYNSKEYADFYGWFNKNIALEHEKIAFIRVDTNHQLQKQ